jgi:hypothetical protein
VTTTPSTFFPSLSLVQDMLLPPNRRCPEFTNIVVRSTTWNRQSKEANPLYDFIRKGSNRSKGWCRNLAGISTSRLDNSQTLQYYDLLLKCTPSTKDARYHFYHAFDMNSRLLKHVRKNDDIPPPEPSSILKRKRTRATTTTRRVSFSLNNSASKQISFDYAASTPSKTTDIHTMKTPQHITQATKQIYDCLAEKLISILQRKEKLQITLKTCANQCIWDGKEKDLTWNQL